MTSDFASGAYPLVVAHRGASATMPENTLDAFAAAVEAGADAVELDVRVTADGVPVVMHDPDVSRSTDGSGLVRDLSLSDIKALNAGGGTGRAEVPTVVEVLELVAGRAGVNFEIKNVAGEPDFDSPRESALVAALEALEETAFPGPVLISSFNWLTIERCREIAPHIPTGFLTIALIDPQASLVYARDAGHQFILPEATAVGEAGERLVRDVHLAGLRLGTWTVDDPTDIERLFSWGVDAVASNDPVGAVEARNRVRAAGGAAG